MLLVVKVTDKRSTCLGLILIILIALLAGCTVPQELDEEESQNGDKSGWGDLYNTLTWDATYISENIIDQFTAGIQNPFRPIFNVTNVLGSDPYSPPTYWRLGSLASYEFHDKGEDPTTRWTNGEIGYRILTPSTEQEGEPYSLEIDESDRLAEFRFQLPLNHSTEIVDVTINPNFPNYLPSAWNGRSGSYIAEDSFKLYDTDGKGMTTITSQTKEAYPYEYGSSVEDLLGIQAYITTDETSSTEGVFEYTMNYKDISETISDAAVYSKTKDDYQSILGSAEWVNIQELYLQLPNEPQNLPSSAYVHNSIILNPKDYRDWAPWVVGNATSTCSYTGQSVFSEAYIEMQRIAPNYYINTNEELSTQLAIPSNQGSIVIADSPGAFGLVFDFDMWLGEYASIADPLSPQYIGSDYEMPHPTPYEDYNEWFLYNKQGTAIHFASLFVTMMRLRGIPSRVVIGYLGGFEDEDKAKRVITNMMLHAWPEVLIPIEKIIPGAPPTIEQRAEWVSFDPLLVFLSDILNTGVPVDMPVISEVSQVVLINSTFPHQTFGPMSFPIANYTETNADSANLNLQQMINLSVRVMMITGPTRWIPWQPACEYIGTEVSFYWSNTGTLSDASFIASSAITSTGFAAVVFDYDIIDHGSPVWFIAQIVFNEGEITEHEVRALSLRHAID